MSTNYDFNPYQTEISKLEVIIYNIDNDNVLYNNIFRLFHHC